MINFYTEKIDETAYTKIIRNVIMFNGDNGKNKSGLNAWYNFKDNWILNILPLKKSTDDKYKSYFDHLEVKTGEGIPWGITGKKIIHMFVNDTKNPFILRSNVMPLAHELLHAIYQDAVGTFHITRKYDAPEGKAGTKGAAASVIVHDNWYGSKETMKFWIRYGFIWLPITIPYYPVKQAKEDYNI
jgi:hypothetical protein